MLGGWFPDGGVGCRLGVEDGELEIFEKVFLLQEIMALGF